MTKNKFNNFLIFSLFNIVLLQFTQQCYADRILGYLVTPSRSHFIIQEVLMRGLAAKGHEVLVISYFPSPETPTLPTYRSIQLTMNDESKEILKNLEENHFQNSDSHFIFRIPQFVKSFSKFTTDTFHDPLVVPILQNYTFDLVVFGWFINDYQLGIAGHFKCPSVLFLTVAPMKMIRSYVGNPSSVATVPSLYLDYKGHMNFSQRFINFFAYCVETIFEFLLNTFVYEPIYKESFPSDKYPSLEDVKLNVSLVLVTSHFSDSMPQPYLPNMVEVSGLHIKQHPYPLPEAIKDWLDNATEDGVIYFSLGSNLKSTTITSDKREAILNSFRKLKQRILWKWEDEHMPEKPDNVQISKWLPQDDILAHSNVILFISHCGKGSLNEAKYHGVPVLCIPIFGDQPKNANELEKEGWGISVKYNDLTEHTFSAGIKEILNNKSYSEIVKRASNLYKDRPQHPLDTAVFWVEYVLRHKGAKHLQSQSVHLNWFQNQSLDVIGSILAVFYIIFKCFLWTSKYLFHKCVAKKPKYD